MAALEIQRAHHSVGLGVLLDAQRLAVERLEGKLVGRRNQRGEPMGRFCSRRTPGGSLKSTSPAELPDCT